MIKDFQRQAGSAHVVIIVALVIGLLGILGLLLYQDMAMQDSAGKNTETDIQTSQDDADEPKDTRSTYTSNEHNYSIRYPSSYRALERQDNGRTTVYIAAKDLSDDEIYSRQDYKMRITVIPNSAGVAPLPQGDTGPGYREIKEYNIDGVQGEQGSYPAIVNGHVSQTETSSTITAFEYNGRIYRFASGSASMGNFDADDYISMIESIDLF